MATHLQAFVEAFVDKRYKKQWLHFLEQTKLGHNPVKGMDALWRELDNRYCIQLPKGSRQHDIDFVRQAVAPYQLTTCHMLSADDAYNQQTVLVADALDMIIGLVPTTIISFLPGKIAFFEGHSSGSRYMCAR